MDIYKEEHWGRRLRVFSEEGRLFIQHEQHKEAELIAEDCKRLANALDQRGHEHRLYAQIPHVAYWEMMRKAGGDKKELRRLMDKFLSDHSHFRIARR